MKKVLSSLLVVILTTGTAVYAQNIITTKKAEGAFPIVAGKSVTPLEVSNHDYFLVHKASELFRHDVQSVTGKSPEIDHGLPESAKNVIIIGSADSSDVIQRLEAEGKLDLSNIRGKWETYKLQIVDHPFKGIDKALVVVGSDRRGTAYGVLTLSRQMGVSPWKWWADVPVKKKKTIYVKGDSHIYGPPAVKYRGIFINDEAPALSGFVNKKFGGFNHKFYKKVFELMLRLKANYLWPAMWGKAFNERDSLNSVLANKYGIAMGTPHNEPMMRSRKAWEMHGKGPWNYQTNDSTLRAFWRKGIQQMDDRESIVTIGMRGNGDKPMSDQRNMALLERIVRDQRQIIKNVTGKNPDKTPQLWALYKEVQQYYDMGMHVPDDVTLLFSDDNWGDIRRLPELKDSTRPGGYGVYYHFDYVGGPRSYKWINTNPLPKIWQQMNLAYQYHARRIWIVNVGDLKPMEFPISFFLDYAWDPKALTAEEIPAYTKKWAKDQFGTKYANEIANILTMYGKYNGRRKPELMSADTYSLHHYREFERVTEDYDQLAQKAETIYQKLPENYKAAHYQLVLYPVKASANLYDMYFDLAKNRWYAKQGRAATNKMGDKVRQHFREDARLANYYNTKMANGKWNPFMNQSNIGYTGWSDPRHDIMPKVDSIQVPNPAHMGVAIEGSDQWWQQTDSTVKLPAFNKFKKNRHYIEVFNRGKRPFKYKISASRSWLNISDPEGKIDDQKRIWVSVDWDKVPAGTHKVTITVAGTGEKVEIQAVVKNPSKPAKNDIDGFVENNGFVSMEAAHYTKAVGADNMRWQTIPDLGRTLSGVSPMPDTLNSVVKPGGNSPHLEYKMYLQNTGDITVHTYMSPTLDIHASGGLRFALSVDDQKPKIVTMNINKNNQSWAQAVSQNIQINKTQLNIDKPGQHTLKFWMVDPGVVLQKIVVDCGGLKSSYLGPPESYHLGTN